MELALKEPTMQANEPVRDAVPSGRRTAILAIDDNADFLQLLKDLLEPSGYEVHTSVNPVKALEMFQRDKDKFSLIILDYYMPQLDGAKTYEWLRKISPKVKVIVCSGADELRLRQIQAQHKMEGFIRKPFRVKDALDLINRVARPPIYSVN